MDERREDWHRGVDENLASLNAGQRVWERELGMIRKLLAETDNLLRGDPNKDTDGAIARLHLVENEINLLKALLLKDAAGGKGIIGRVEDLESEERKSDRWLKVWIAVIGLLSALLVAAASNFDRIAAYLNRKNTDPLSRKIENAKHPKARRRHVIIRQEPEPEDPPED
jgi:hypothetical protein